MRYIVDASFVLAFLLPDEYNEDVDIIFNQFKAGITELSSTPLLHFEVANGLEVAQLRKRISLSYCKERLKEFINYRINLTDVDLISVLDLAQKDNLTVYDACYLYLSKSEGIPLLTLDKKLQDLT